MEWAGIAEARLEASLPASRAGLGHRNSLSLRAGERGRVACLILLQVEIGQVEFIWVWLCATNGSLNVSYALLLQGGLADFAVKAAIRNYRIQVSAFFQVGQSFGQ